MKIFAAFLCLVLFFALVAVVEAESPSGEEESQDVGVLSIDLEDPSIATMRLEIFDGVTSEKVFDSGVRVGANLTIADRDFDSVPVDAAMRYEFRAWNHAGDLILSQVSNLTRYAGSRGDAGRIYSLSFETIPAGTALVSPSIELDGNVNVAGNLEVIGNLEVPELLKTGGASFFSSCPSGSSIRQIESDGLVQCESVQGAGDDLGNHQATQTLEMGSQWIEFDAETGLRGPGGAEMRTGPAGDTFQFRSGALSASSIVHFVNNSGEIVTSIAQNGNLEFRRGQKICSVTASTASNTWRDTLIVGAGWTASRCETYQQVTLANAYHLGCVFNDGFSLGARNGGLPNPNCGW